jgi:mannose-6-phosphate isomerase-like protein (cupin superfamily)
MSPIVRGPDEGERVPRGDYSHRILAEVPDLEVIEMTFRPGFEGVTPHTHDDHTDAFYVLSGEAEFVVGDETVRAGPGGFFCAPRDTLHGFRNAGDTPLRMLNVHAPNVGFAVRMRER